MHLFNFLKRSRKKAKLTIQDMAFLLDYDPSNLSKFERGVKSTPKDIVLGYHIVTQCKLDRLFQQSVLGLLESVKSNTIKLLSVLEEELQTPKVMARIQALEEVLDNVGCLKAMTEEEVQEREEDYE